MIDPNGKPNSMSVKDYIIRVMSIRTNTSEKIIDAIITHQFQNANEATQKCNSIEFSGFGKFLFNEKKAGRKLNNVVKKMNEFNKRISEGGLSETKLEYTTKVLNDLEKTAEAIKPKIKDESIITDIRGVEK